MRLLSGVRRILQGAREFRLPQWQSRSERFAETPGACSEKRRQRRRSGLRSGKRDRPCVSPSNQERFCAGTVRGQAENISRSEMVTQRDGYLKATATLRSRFQLREAVFHLGRLQRLDDFRNIPGHDLIEVIQGQVHAMIGEPVLRVIVSADFFLTPA